MLGRGHIVNTTGYEPDYDAIKAAPTRVVLAYGTESDGLITQRGAMASPLPLGLSRRGSRATTAASWAGSTVRPATLTRSPPGCARCSTAESG